MAGNHKLTKSCNITNKRRNKIIPILYLSPMILIKMMAKLTIGSICNLLTIFYPHFVSFVPILKITIKSQSWTEKLSRTDFILLILSSQLYFLLSLRIIFQFYIPYNQYSAMITANPLMRSVLSSNVDHHKNQKMNKSALLFNKWEKELIKDLPRYVTGSRKNSKLKTININKGLTNQGIKSKSIHRLLENSIKQAMKSENNFKQGQRRASAFREVIQPYPRRVLNLLYRQNIKNYNPYVSTLSQLDEIRIPDQEKDRIRKLCFIGIARNYFQMKKYFKLPQYSRVGILIRTYMVEVMRGHLEQKIQSQPYSVYIKINQTALSFNAQDRPKQLEEHLTKKRYSDIIEGVNKIIVKQYERYKRGNFQFINTNFTYSEIILYIIVAIIIVCIMIWSPDDEESNVAYAGFFSVVAVAFGGMGLAWVQCKKNLGKICAPQNMTGSIEEKIRQYLKSVSNDTLTWRVGPDFYWLEIENIKIKKRKLHDKQDKF